MKQSQMHQAQVKARLRKRRRRNSIPRKNVIWIMALCFITALLLNHTAAAGDSEAEIITLQAEDVTITQGETVPKLTAKAKCSGDMTKKLNTETGFTIKDLVEELNQGKGFTMTSTGDGTKEGKFEIKAALSSEITTPLLSEWFGKVNIEVKSGTLKVKNPYGKWDGKKFKHWDGTYAANDFITYYGKTYYFDVDGKMVTGWKKIDGNKYYFNKKGVMQTGWMEKDGAKYCFAENGIMHVGWQTIDDAKYYFDKKGKMLTGKQKIGSRKCVFAKDGKLKSMEGGVDPKLPMIALTFDDGPGARTEEIVKVLKKNHARATFFMTGTSAGIYPEAIKKMQEAECELGNHSYNHPQLSNLDEAGIKKQIGDTNNTISQAVGQPATVIRPPYGAINEAVKMNAGSPLILWSIDTLDWQTRNAKATVDHVLANVKDGDIVLMHDIYSESVDAAIELIPKLIAQGYQLVTVSELAEARGITLENGGVYSSFWK